MPLVNLFIQRARGTEVLLDTAENERLAERAKVLEDVRVAEDQFASGEGIDHDEPKRRVLASLRR
jgi:hypothetical protein